MDGTFRSDGRTFCALCCGEVMVLDSGYFHLRPNPKARCRGKAVGVGHMPNAADFEAVDAYMGRLAPDAP